MNFMLTRNFFPPQIKPAFLSGLQILLCLDPLDVEEVRHYRDPPVGVVKIMDAVCLLFNHPPGWESARQLLSRADFFQVGKKCLVSNQQLDEYHKRIEPSFISVSLCSCVPVSLAA